MRGRSGWGVLRFEGFLAAGALWVSASSYEIGSSGEVEGGGRVFAPAGDLLSFASPKESKQRKGDPTVCVPALRFGQPAVLASSGVSLELAALRFAQTIASPDPLAAVLLGAYRGDGGAKQPNSHSGHCFARPHFAGASAARWAQLRLGRAQRRPVWLLGCCRLSTPCGCACGGAVSGWHVRRSARASLTDSPRLFERSASARSEFRGARRNRPAPGLPRPVRQQRRLRERHHPLRHADGPCDTAPEGRSPPALSLVAIALDGGLNNTAVRRTMTP